MKLTVLVENSVPTGSHCQGEAGLSVLVETQEQKILFDTGNSRLLVQNAPKLGVRLSEVDQVALSHGHGDHTAGLGALAALLSKEGRRMPVQLHPLALASRMDEEGEMGFAIDRKVFEDAFVPRFSSLPTKLDERLIWLGEIPRHHAFEERSFGMRAGAPDFVPDDTALVYRHPDGLVILAGCSHSGICNIVDYAVDYTGDDRVLDIVGGFHLHDEEDAYLEKVCACLQVYHPKQLHPCHCTGLRAKLALNRIAPVGAVSVGTVLQY